jgi:hypothetical protein
MSAAAITTDITSTTGIELMGPAPRRFQVLCDAGGTGTSFCRPKPGNKKNCAGTAGIAQNLNSQVWNPLIQYRWSR